MGANAQTSVPAFTAGQVLTAAQVTGINTGIPVFASSTERDAAFGGTGEKTLAEGQMAYLEDTNATQYYDGSSWAAVAGGKILQVVSTTKTDAYTNATASFADVTGLSVSITPSAATSKVLVIVSLSISSTTNIVCASKLLRGSTAIFIADAAGSRTPVSTSSRPSAASLEMFSHSLVYLDSPATTSATTYKVQALGITSTVYVNRTYADSDASTSPRQASSITVMEVSA